MELKFVTNSYFKQLFQNLRPKLQYSKNRFFVTSHFGTLFFMDDPKGSYKRWNMKGGLFRLSNLVSAVCRESRTAAIIEPVV